MKILAFDTSSPACSVAIQDDDNIKSLHKIAPMQHARLILPMIKELLDSFQLSLKELDGIAYGCGPGSFTGTRIASSVIQGLGLATQVPILQVSSLATMAQAAFMEKQWSKLLVALDARMEKIYWAQYEINQKGYAELIGQEKLCAPQEISISHINLIEWCGIGDGWEKYRDEIKIKLQFSPQFTDYKQLPNAIAMLKLAQIKLDRGDWVDANCAIPDYLR